MTLALAFFLLYILLQVADVYTTVRALKIPGNYERNKLKAWLNKKMGLIPASILMKSGIAILLWFSLQEIDGIVWQIFAGLDALYVYVVYKNWKVGKK